MTWWKEELQATSFLINANFSVDHRALIILTNCLLLSLKGQAWSSLFIFLVVVTCTFAVAESCSPPLVQCHLLPQWAEPESKAVVMGITQIILDTPTKHGDFSNTGNQSRTISIRVTEQNKKGAKTMSPFKLLYMIHMKTWWWELY